MNKPTIDASTLSKLLTSHSYRTVVQVWRVCCADEKRLCDFFFAWQSLNNLPTPIGIVRIYGESRKWFGVNVDGTPMVEDALTGDCFELSEAFGLDDLPTLKEIAQFCEEVRKRRGPGNDEGSMGKDW